MKVIHNIVASFTLDLISWGEYMTIPSIYQSWFGKMSWGIFFSNGLRPMLELDLMINVEQLDFACAITPICKCAIRHLLYEFLYP